MAEELERRFRVQLSDLFLLDWNKVDVLSTLRITQGYFPSMNASVVTRVRLTTQGVGLGQQCKAEICVKSKHPTIENGRLEFEYPIPVEDARQMLASPAICPHQIHKIRRRILLGQHVWELDTFLRDNAGMLIAEVELKSMDEPVDIPFWAKDEVTGRNILLAQFPFRLWSHKPGMWIG